MTLASVKRQMKKERDVSNTSVDKWRVFRDVGDARTRLGLQDRALAVLNALLSFFPVAELSNERNLVVFPSNAQLSARANGIAGTTLRKVMSRCERLNGCRIMGWDEQSCRQLQEP
ncbi:hypothetical protein E0H39_37980, partial [Rhizobium leguminosarum bv. viciae]